MTRYIENVNIPFIVWFSFITHSSNLTKRSVFSKKMICNFLLVRLANSNWIIELSGFLKISFFLLIVCSLSFIKQILPRPVFHSTLYSIFLFFKLNLTNFPSIWTTIEKVNLSKKFSKQFRNTNSPTNLSIIKSYLRALHSTGCSP